MSRSKKQTEYIPIAFESENSVAPKCKNGKRKDRSANIYYSMLMSNAWRKLTGNQKELYLFCKLQQFGESVNYEEHATDLEKENGEKQNLSDRFTMNKHKWCEMYQLYSEQNQNRFYKDMNALIENGFIELLQSGRTNKTKNIYKFSSKWKELGWVDRKGKKPMANKY